MSFRCPSHGSFTLLACPWGQRSLNGLVIASGTLDALAAVRVKKLLLKSCFSFSTTFALEIFPLGVTFCFIAILALALSRCRRLV